MGSHLCPFQLCPTLPSSHTRSPVPSGVHMFYEHRSSCQEYPPFLWLLTRFSKLCLPQDALPILHAPRIPKCLYFNHRLVDLPYQTELFWAGIRSFSSIPRLSRTWLGWHGGTVAESIPYPFLPGKSPARPHSLGLCCFESESGHELMAAETPLG